jgi:Ca-activated chloride channel family protein
MYFGSPYLGIVLAVICGLGCLYRFFGYKQPYYTFSLVTFMRPNLTYNSRFVKKIILLLRFITLVFLCFIVAQPQIPGALQRLPVEGIEIFIALDLSASMNAVDDQRDTRRRVEIARDEAINFIKQRPFDAIGLSVFGANSLVRCPLTHDHASLISIIKSTDVSNTVFPDGTVLAIGLTSALNKFKDSKARSK